MNPAVWEFLNQAGPLALLAWAVVNERRMTRLETLVEGLAKRQHAGQGAAGAA